MARLVGGARNCAAAGLRVLLARGRSGQATGASTRRDALARTLGVSLRGLQRLASEHGASVRALIEAAREAAARQLLGDAKRSIDEVAEMVGYADRRAFVRAFKRWTGQTPAASRRSPGPTTR